MSKLGQALADIQAKFDEKARIVEGLADKNRSLVAENSELKRQLDLVYKQLAEQTLRTTAAAVGPVEASNGSFKPPSDRAKLSTDAVSDVLVFLNRFNIDAAQIAYRQWRFVAETMLTTQCLRKLNCVTLERVKKTSGSESHFKAIYTGDDNSFDSWTDWESEPSKDDECIFVVSYGRSGEPVTTLRGNTHEETRRALTFQSFDAASDYFRRLTRSSTIDHIALKFLVPNVAFFQGLASVAATVSAKKLTLVGCHLEGVDAGIFQTALLQFQSVSELALGRVLLPAHVSDDFLDAVGGKLALTRLRHGTAVPIGPETATFDATDVGIMQFLFQQTTKEVKLQISHVNVSPTFCTALFKKALSEPAKNDLFLAMRVRNLEQDFSGILYWRLPEDEFMNAKKEVYEAEVSRGKRLRLSIKIESCGAVSTIKFRRCNGNADAGDAEYRSRHGGYRGRGWFR